MNGEPDMCTPKIAPPNNRARGRIEKARRSAELAAKLSPGRGGVTVRRWREMTGSRKRPAVLLAGLLLALLAVTLQGNTHTVLFFYSHVSASFFLIVLISLQFYCSIGDSYSVM